MKKSLSIIALGTILFIIIIIIIGDYKNKYLDGHSRTRNNFINLNRKQQNDGQMKFDYLVNPNYGSNILNTYYQNDDTRLNASRVIKHPYQVRNNKLFGIAQYINLTKAASDKLYADTGVRL